MVTSYTEMFGGNFKITWIVCNLNVPIPPQFISFVRVSFSSFFLIWVLDTVCLFIIIHITFLWYLMTKFLDEIEVWCHWPVAFRGSWILMMPESIIFGFLLEFIFVWLRPRSNAHIVALLPCLCFPFDIMLLEESYEAILINVMKKIFYLRLIQLFI